MSAIGLGVGLNFGPNAVGPVPRLALYKDTSSVVTTGTGTRTQVVSAGPFTSATGAPLLATDTDTGGAKTFRFGSGDTLVAPAGAGSFLATGPSTVYFVMRYRLGIQGANYPLLDGTAAGTKHGYQVQLGDQTIATIYECTIGARVWNGSAWIVDTQPNQASYGHWWRQKKCVIAIRLTSSGVQLFRDGMFVWSAGQALSFTYPSADLTALLKLGGAPVDVDCFEAFDSAHTDALIQSHTLTLGGRFGVNLPFVLAGDPALLNGSNNAAFPYGSIDVLGKIHVSTYDDFDNSSPTGTTSDYVSADASPLAFTRSQITQNTNPLRYSDIKTSAVLSDGSVIRVTFAYDSNSNTQNYILVKRSTDGGLTFPGTWTQISTGGPYVTMAVNEAPVENPGVPGQLHMAVSVQVSNASTKRSILILHSSDHGQTWPTVTAPTQLDGPTLSKDLAEPGLEYRHDGLMCTIRDATTAAVTGQQASINADGTGTSWSAIHAAAPGWASGQQVKTFTDGTEITLTRPTGGQANAALFYRDGTGAWNSAWSTRTIIDPMVSIMYYPAVIEMTPNVVLVGWGRTGSDPTKTNVMVQPFVPTWLLKNPPAMPGHVTPNTVTVDGSISTTYQIQAFGCGDPYTYTFGTHGSTGSSISATGLWTIGSTNGTDVVHIFDAQGYELANSPLTITVINVPFSPLQIASLVYWEDGDSVHVSGSNVTQLTDLTANANNFVPDTGQFNPTVGTAINGHGTIHFVPSERMVPAAAISPALTSAGELWMVCQNDDDGVTRCSPMCITGGSGSNNLFPFEVNRHLYDNSFSTTRQDTGIVPATGMWNQPWMYNVRADNTAWDCMLHTSDGVEHTFHQGSNTFGASTVRIGQGDVQSYTGRVACILVFGAILSSGDRASVKAYLQSKYGIT